MLLLQLTPFRLEDFCCAIVAEENSKLICEIFSAIVRLTVRESEHVGSWLAPHDEKDSVYLASMCLDSLTWPELIRGVLQSSPEYSDGLRIVEQRSFPCVSAKDKLDLLGILCGAILRLPGVIRAALNTDISIQHEENCRNCQKPGDLICCEMCPATYHLECASPPLKEVPEGEWFCPICKFNQVSGDAARKLLGFSTCPRQCCIFVGAVNCWFEARDNVYELNSSMRTIFVMEPALADSFTGNLFRRSCCSRILKWWNFFADHRLVVCVVPFVLLVG